MNILRPPICPELTCQRRLAPNAAPATKSNSPTSPNTAPATKSNTPTLPNAAPATKSDTPTSPNTAPATQNDSHDWCPSHLKRHLQCAEHQASPSNLTKYCACHAKVHSKIKEKCDENSWSVKSNAGTIRAWSEHESEHELVISHPPVRRGYFSRFGDCILYWKLQHFALRLSTQISPNTAPATKSDTPTLPNAAPATKSDTPTSPNTAPATQNDSHDWCPSHLKRHLQCAEHQASPSNLTKYCACHAKAHSKIKQKCAENSWRIPMRGRFEHDPNMNPNMNSSSRTRPFAEVTFRASETHFVLKITTFRVPAIYPDFTEYCACHKKWHSNITKCCACHKRWYSKITKYCACHELGLLLYSYFYCTATLLLLLLHCYFTATFTARLLLLHCYFTVTFTALLLYCYFYCTVTLLHCYFTLTFTALLLHYCTVTLLLLLLHCYFTVTFTALLLYCYFYCTVTLLLLLLELNCYCTGLFAFLNLRNSEVSQLNFLWLFIYTNYQRKFSWETSDIRMRSQLNSTVK